VVDHEVELRPVLRRLADVADVAVADQVRKLLLHRRREQALVDADVLQAGTVGILLRPFHQPLVERIHQLLVVQAEGMLGEVLVGVVADGVALPGIGLEPGVLLVHLGEPAVAAGREDGVREHAPGAGVLVHFSRASCFMSLVRKLNFSSSE
jgi:hypothetical protein